MYKWIKKLLCKPSTSDNAKFDEIRLWIAMIYDDFGAFDRTNEEINAAGREIYKDMGRAAKDYDCDNNHSRCEALRYFMSNAQKKGRL